MSKITLENGITVTGATLLTVEEAEQLPKSILNINHPWWLRSPGSDTNNAAYVDFFGDVYDYGACVDYDDCGVRPALNINLESSNLSIGDKFTFGDKEFDVVFKDKALCTDIIGECTFRGNWKAFDANDYEASDVKKFVDAWYKNYFQMSFEEARKFIIANFFDGEDNMKSISGDEETEALKMAVIALERMTKIKREIRLAISQLETLNASLDEYADISEKPTTQEE